MRTKRYKIDLYACVYLQNILPFCLVLPLSTFFLKFKIRSTNSSSCGRRKPNNKNVTIYFIILSHCPSIYSNKISGDTGPIHGLPAPKVLVLKNNGSQ